MLGCEAAERVTKSREVRRVLNKQDEGLFRKSRVLGARDFSCTVSGVGHEPKRSSFRRVRKTSGTQGSPVVTTHVHSYCFAH